MDCLVFPILVVLLSVTAHSSPSCAAETTPTTQAFPSDTYNGFGCGSMGRLVLPRCSPQWEQCGCSKRAFNVSTIWTDLTALRLGEMDLGGHCGASCLLSDFVPIPFRPRLTNVELFNIWVAPDDGPFPVGQFLVNIKGILRGLRLVDIHLPTVTRATFEGFAHLDKLELQRNRMSLITLDAFESLTLGKEGAVTPTLSQFHSEGNSLAKFDWSVFKPVATSLTEVFLRINEITDIYVSEYFTMPAVEWVDLSGNNLTRIDDILLASVSTAEVRPFLRLGVNRFCASDVECGCSALDNLWSFFQKAPRNKLCWSCAYFHASDWLTCGNYTIRSESPDFWSRFPPLSDQKDGRDYFSEVDSLTRTRLKNIKADNGRRAEKLFAHQNKSRNSTKSTKISFQ
ncbi:uncharacterized protein LOC129597318 [Paramacrobiotus metropolitanus]|uniref:uncharacterized protein LOC129597318 n=1 Tax=Paramacrobiotus metropolitanus TaxID=2943436 RepID=UPI002446119D|nr:uncharacterized protein LOC129597318 [Paramacrobiotus metropolitanus]